MAKKQEEKAMCSCNCKPHHGHMGNTVYGLGFVGAMVYVVQHAHNFNEGFWGFVKAALWPAYFVYKLFEVLKF